ncbi:MAG: MBL fold metallo-hydrolase [Terrimicrobiaceae bacterium]
MRTYTGGIFDTNAFLFDFPEGRVLFDAPQGADAAFANDKIDVLFLTHGHFDHVADAAAIQTRHGCRVVLHELTVPMVTNPDFFREWGYGFGVEPVASYEVAAEGKSSLLGEPVELFHVPGHCPGSLCLFIASMKVLVGGDVLFAGGVGRWDLPGGDFEQLISGIHQKLLPLPPSTRVLPGHGPATTIGWEAGSNPFLRQQT